MHSQFYIGIVENRDDPLKLGRCQVRVFGVHSESLDDVPVSTLPWAIPMMPITSASLSGIGSAPTGIVNGTMVMIYFQDTESKQMPIMMGTIPSIPQNQNSGLKGGISEEAFSLNGQSSAPATTTPVTTESGSTLTTSDGTPVTTGTSSSTPSTIGKPASEWVTSSLTRGMALLKTYEGFIPGPYKDSANVPTIGYGTTIYPDGTRVRMTDTPISKETGLEYVKIHIKNNVIPYIVSKVKVPITESMFESLASFIYNVGGGNFSKSTLLLVLNKADYIGASDQFLEWTKAGGSVLAGLVKRRKDEKALFVTDGIPSNNPEVNKEVTDPNSSDVQYSPTTANPTPPSPTKAGMVDVITNANSLGFKDHSGKYPLKSLLKEPDTNRIFRRIARGTLIEKKNSSRRNKIQSPRGDINFSEPKSPYNSTYPYNRGVFTESGHAFELDDTPGSERIHLYHTSGTYTEIDKFGRQVNKIVGDSYTITDRNGYIYIDGTARIVVGSDVKLSVSGNLDVSVSGDLNYDVAGSINVKTGGNINTQAGGRIGSRSAGLYSVDGEKIYLNSGKSPESPIFTQRSKVSLDYEVQVPESYFDGEVLELEEISDTAVTNYYKEAVKSGKTTEAELEAGKNVVPGPKDETPPPTQQVIPQSCGMFTSDNIPGTTQISKYFTIASVSTNAAVSKYAMAPQRGLTVPQIACNLKMLAENSLDPIRTKYPNMFITSGFRTGSGTSQHELGQAADMQFTGASKAEYFEIAKWIKDNVPFDKLLLEYKTTGSGAPWIHIAFRENPRKEVYTFMNHSKKSNNLVDLSKA